MWECAQQYGRFDPQATRGFVTAVGPRSLGARWAAVMDGVDDLARVDSLEVDRHDPEVRIMPELALVDRQRDTFVRHLARLAERNPKGFLIVRFVAFP